MCPSSPQVRDFQSVIGREVRRQFAEQVGGTPDVLLACVGGGSNAMGLFHEFVEDEGIRIVGVEAGMVMMGVLLVGLIVGLLLGGVCCACRVGRGTSGCNQC